MQTIKSGNLMRLVCVVLAAVVMLSMTAQAGKAYAASCRMHRPES